MEKDNQRKLKIAMLGHKRIPSREGGIEVVVEELATRMVEKGHSVTVYNRKGHHVSGKEFDVLKKQSMYKGIRIKSVFTIDKRGLAAMTSSFFAAIKVSLSDYDVIHFHAEGPCAMMWIPKLFGKKCFATIHGLDWARSKWGGFATWYIKFGEKVAAKLADEIIVLSENVKEYFLDTYNRETVFVPNGVNKPKIVSDTCLYEKWELRKNDYILFLGRIVPEKGVHYLIEAFTLLDSNKKLVIAGGVSDTDEYMKELYELSKDNPNIIFTGFVQGDELGALYSNTYLYILPSDLEGMPLSLLEAMSYGNCVVGSNIREIAEVVEDKAVLFEKGNVKDLKEKIFELFNDSCSVNEYKKKSVEYICDKHNWNNIVDKTIDIYRK